MGGVRAGIPEIQVRLSWFILPPPNTELVPSIKTASPHTEPLSLPLSQNSTAGQRGGSLSVIQCPPTPNRSYGFPSSPSGTVRESQNCRVLEGALKVI
ncbi:UNVERIFIED_CONTAM: hypothetical protein K2H54_019107 [Gekko kuhli]